MKRASGQFGWTLPVLLVAVLGLAWIWLNRVPSRNADLAADRPAAPAIGYAAPQFTLTALNGEEFDLSSLRGTPVVLNFWATWCPPCRAELPELQAASERYEGQVAIIGVNQAETAGAVAEAAEGIGLTFPIPLDRSGSVSRLYGVRSLPTTFFIDRDGVIRQIQNGPVTDAVLAQLLQTIHP